MGRYPAVSVTIACSTGIVVDRYLALASSGLLATAGILLLAWFFYRRRRPGSAAIVALGLCSVIAALHHHQYWHDVPSADIGRFLARDSILVRLQATVVSNPELIPAEVAARRSFERDDVTRLDVDCRAVDVNGDWQSISGRVRIIVKRNATHLAPGDEVTLSGWLVPLPRVRNPGGLDFGEIMRRKKIRATLSVSHPELIQVTRSGASWLTRLRRSLRSRCEDVLDAGLSDRTRGIGLAMLLGNRTRIAPDVRTAFVNSGTVHILAISGLHVGILAMFLLGTARVLRLPDRTTFVAVVACLSIYLLIADLRPPMVRAYILIVVWCASRLVRRVPVSANSLAVSALIILAMNPTDLFNVGAQLSFVAVAAIYWLSATKQLPQEADDVASDPNSARGKAALRPNWMNVLIELSMIPVPWWKVAVTIWALSLPLVVHTWHVVPIIGVVINSIILIPVVALGLWCGFLALAIGSVWTVPGIIFAFGLDAMLRLLMWIVDLAAHVPFGHFHLPGPPLWVLVLFYGLAAAGMVMTLQLKRSRWLWAGMALWTIFGCSLGARSDHPQDLKVTVISISHGLSVLIEAPTGETLLYDAGSQLGGETAARIVEDVLWKRGHSRLDAVVVSHADADHYGGVRPLLKTISIGRLYASRHFRNPAEPDTGKLLAFAGNAGIPVTANVSRGDTIDLAPDVSIRVLHPETSRDYESDNGASIVLQIDYAGRRILLTGDLRDSGLAKLLEQAPRRVDLLLAPHHGDPESNPRALAEWAAPRLVVASSRRSFDVSGLRAVYEDTATVVSTSDVGAVELVVTPTGAVSYSTFLDRE